MKHSNRAIRRPSLHETSTLAAVLVAASAYGVADVAFGCDTIPICAHWPSVDNEDASYGDLMTESSYPARGARVTVIRPYPEPAVGFFLDDEGCGSFDSQFPTGHKVLLHTETVLGLGTSGQIHIKVYPNFGAMSADANSFCAIDVADLPAGWGIDVECPETGAHLVTLIATATETIRRLHALEGSLLVGEHSLKIWLDPTRQNASAPLGQIRIGTAGQEQDASALRKKFILAHEIGHWVQEEVVGDIWEVDYGYGPDMTTPLLDPHPDVIGNPLDEECRFAVEYVAPEAVSTEEQLESHPNRHGIRSAEFASGAMPEGFGHFVAAVAFNSDLSEDADGVFRYYKDVHHDLDAYDEFEDPGVQDRRVSLLGGSDPGVLGGPDRWVELQCPQDWDHPLNQATLDQEVSSEIDWLRFFWRFITASQDETWTSEISVSVPTFWDVVHLVTFTQVNDPWSVTDHILWPNMLGTITDVGSGLDVYEDRFNGLTTAHGVYNHGS